MHFLINPIHRSVLDGLGALLVQGKRYGSGLWCQTVFRKLLDPTRAANLRRDRLANRAMSQSGPEQDAGFALVMVLWFSALLGLLSMNLLREGGATKTLAVTNMARLQAEAVADGAINRVILKYLDPINRAQFLSGGRNLELQSLSPDVTLSLEREAGKININTASFYLLFAMFCHMGATVSEAEMISAGVIAWRTPLDHLRSDSVDTAYLDAERPYGPRRGAFRAVAELRLVLGMTDALQAAVAPFLTIWSHNAAVDCDSASDVVREVLAAAAEVLRSSEHLEGDRPVFRTCNNVSDANETLTIGARIASSSSLLERQAIVRFSEERRRPFAILDWH